jgi:predicted PurR-regulated permease PerM
VVTAVFGLIVAVLDSTALAIMGVPLVVLWGVLAFITNFIPNIGFIIGLVPPALVALLTGGWQLALAVVRQLPFDLPLLVEELRDPTADEILRAA